MKTKNVGYAYASSPLAKHMKMYHTGCWFLGIYDDSEPMKEKDVVFTSVSQLAVHEEAKKYDFPSGKYSMELVQA
jgi:hypothetical protein